jgi:hypothetical protein
MIIINLTSKRLIPQAIEMGGACWMMNLSVVFQTIYFLSHRETRLTLKSTLRQITSGITFCIFSHKRRPEEREVGLMWGQRSIQMWIRCSQWAFLRRSHFGRSSHSRGHHHHLINYLHYLIIMSRHHSKGRAMEWATCLSLKCRGRWSWALILELVRLRLGS